jgi:hypothetical protein
MKKPMTLQRAADILGVPMAYLLTGKIGKPALTVIQGGKADEPPAPAGTAPKKTKKKKKKRCLREILV